MIEKRYGTLEGLTVPVMVYENVQEADVAAGKEGTVLSSANDNFHYRGGPAEDTRQYICDMLEAMGKTYPSDATFKIDGEDITVKAGDKILRFWKPVMKDGKPKVDSEGNEVTTWIESQGSFVKRFAAIQGWDDLKQFQSQIDAWAKSLPDVGEDGKPTGTTHALAVDAKAAERKPKAPPVLAKKYKVIAAVKLQSGNGAIEDFNKRVLSKIEKVFTPTPADQVKPDAKRFSGTFDVLEKGETKSVTLDVLDQDAESLGWLVKEYLDWVASQAANQL